MVNKVQRLTALTCVLTDASYNLWVSLISSATFFITARASQRLVYPWKLGVNSLVILCNMFDYNYYVLLSYTITYILHTYVHTTHTYM